MTATVNLAPLAKLRFVDNNGVPLAGGKLFTYAAGTTTKQNSYTDASGSTPNANPVLLDSRGEASVWFDQALSYKVTLAPATDTDPPTSPFWTIDNISAGNAYLLSLLAAPTGGTLIGYVNGHTLYDKVARTHDIDDYTSLAAACTALAGTEGTGYNTAPAFLNLQGKTISLTADLFVPTNLSFVNGTISGAHNLISRNPYLANTGLRASSAYWPYMTCAHQNVTFDCRVILSGYIGGRWDNCTFDGVNGALVMVNVNGLWTEFNIFSRCFMASNATDLAAIIEDGNVAGGSAWQTIVGGTSGGTSDGSMGYNKFIACKVDAQSGADGIVITGGATLYNNQLEFVGYVRGNSNAFVHIENGRLSALLNVQLESFGATGYGILLDNTASAQLWYCDGSMRSASPQMRMSQGASSDVRANTIDVQGFALTDSSGATVFNGDGFPSQIRINVSARQSTSLTPVVSVFKAAAQSINSNTLSQVQFDTATYDSNSYFGSNQYQPLVAGYYQVTVQVTFSASATASAAYITLLRNGNIICKSDGGTVGVASMVRTLSYLTYMNGTTNYLSVNAFCFDNAGGITLASGADVTTFKAVLVRPA